MADEKKKEDAKQISLLNRGKRTFEGTGPDGLPVRHAPGEIRAYSLDGAKKLEGYPDLVDITKLPGTIDSAKLESDNKALNDENARLKAELAALGDKKEDLKKEKIKA